jgi:alcohol dehydrogenase YqhD (iron-dependent ADH family)
LGPITEGSEDERIDEAIAKTKEFFETMELKDQPARPWFDSG